MKKKLASFFQFILVANKLSGDKVSGSAGWNEK